MPPRRNHVERPGIRVLPPRVRVVLPRIRGTPTGIRIVPPRDGHAASRLPTHAGPLRHAVRPLPHPPSRLSTRPPHAEPPAGRAGPAATRRIGPHRALACRGTACATCCLGLSGASSRERRHRPGPPTSAPHRITMGSTTTAAAVRVSRAGHPPGHLEAVRRVPGTATPSRVPTAGRTRTTGGALPPKTPGAAACGRVRVVGACVRRTSRSTAKRPAAALRPRATRGRGLDGGNRADDACASVRARGGVPAPGIRRSGSGPRLPNGDAAVVGSRITRPHGRRRAGWPLARALVRRRGSVPAPTLGARLRGRGGPGRPRTRTARVPWNTSVATTGSGGVGLSGGVGSRPRRGVDSPGDRVVHRTEGRPGVGGGGGCAARLRRCRGRSCQGGCP